MNVAHGFHQLARNNAWANERLYTACGALSHDELVAARTSFFPTILATLAHLVLVDRYYLDALEGGGRGARVWDDERLFDRFESVRAAQREADRRLLAYCAGLDGAQLDAEVALERRHGVVRERAGDVLLHLVQHQIHHRGQVHAMLSGTRIAPPQLDEYFLREDRAKAEAELAAAGID